MCVSEPSRSRCHETVGLLCLVWCAPAHAFTPAENKFCRPISKYHYLFSHIRHDLVIPDTDPVADVFATRGVFGRIAPLIACGPKV